MKSNQRAELILTLAATALTVTQAIAQGQASSLGATDAQAVTDPRNTPGKPVAWIGSSLYSTDRTRFDGTVEWSFIVYVVEPDPKERRLRQNFAVDKRSLVQVSEAAKRIEAGAEDRAVLVRGLLAGTVEVPAKDLDPSITDASKKTTLPLVSHASIDDPKK